MLNENYNGLLGTYGITCRRTHAPKTVPMICMILMNVDHHLIQCLDTSISSFANDTISSQNKAVITVNVQLSRVELDQAPVAPTEGNLLLG